MTTFVFWTSIDNRGITALNFASDSRFSYKNNKKIEIGKKLFASQNYPEIFGFTGDVTICYMILGQIISFIDELDGLASCETIEKKQETIYKEIQQIFNKYPHEQHQMFSIFYGTKIGNGLNAKFGVLRILNKNNCDIKKESYKLNDKDTMIIFDGSGKSQGEKDLVKWKKSDTGSYSRSVFDAFFDTINSNKDDQTNNILQMVSLYRGRQKPIPTAYYYDGKVFLYGKEIYPQPNRNIEIRNECFERYDFNGNILPNAQKQPKPK